MEIDSSKNDFTKDQVLLPSMREVESRVHRVQALVQQLRIDLVDLEIVCHDAEPESPEFLSYLDKEISRVHRKMRQVSRANKAIIEVLKIKETEHKRLVREEKHKIEKELKEIENQIKYLEDQIAKGDALKKENLLVKNSIPRLEQKLILLSKDCATALEIEKNQIKNDLQKVATAFNTDINTLLKSSSGPLQRVPVGLCRRIEAMYRANLHLQNDLQKLHGEYVICLAKRERLRCSRRPLLPTDITNRTPTYDLTTSYRSDFDPEPHKPWYHRILKKKRLLV